MRAGVGVRLPGEDREGQIRPGETVGFPASRGRLRDTVGPAGRSLRDAAQDRPPFQDAPSAGRLRIGRHRVADSAENGRRRQTGTDRCAQSTSIRSADAQSDNRPPAQFGLQIRRGGPIEPGFGSGAPSGDRMSGSGLPSAGGPQGEPDPAAARSTPIRRDVDNFGPVDPFRRGQKGDGRLGVSLRMERHPCGGTSPAGLQRDGPFDFRSGAQGTVR